MSSYGEFGLQIMTATLRNMFPLSPEEVHLRFPRLNLQILIEEVLVPEVTVLLITEDLGLSDSASAAQILRESRVYGNTMYPAEDDDHPLLISLRPDVPIKEELDDDELTLMPKQKKIAAIKYRGEVIDLT